MSTSSESMPFVILIAPNVSEQMGGEAIKSLQIYLELATRGISVHQITHSRVRNEMKQKYPEISISYIEDDWLQRLLWKSVVLRLFLNVVFFRRAAALAEVLVKKYPNAVVHYTAPVSPVMPMYPIKGAPVVIGPINGNIHHPPAFRNRESWGDFFRRLCLVPGQLFHRTFFSGKQTADVLLVAGGERTHRSLRLAGCRESQFRDSLDSGIPSQLRDKPLIMHEGRNRRFVHNGRLVPHKGTDLIIKSLTRTRNPVELDVIGRGPEKPRIERLTADLGLQDRVHFIEWFPDHSKLNEALRQYRGFIFPSLAEANGIVVQEAMMMGLPVVCADWGGPSLLVTPECGVLIEPTSEEALIAGLADAMDRLSDDSDLANRMAHAGRAIALERGFSWSDLIEHWISMYQELSERPAAASSPAQAGRCG
jgi:glycosyltransferase involved in cell wall biosynthesis